MDANFNAVNDYAENNKDNFGLSISIGDGASQLGYNSTISNAFATANSGTDYNLKLGKYGANVGGASNAALGVIALTEEIRSWQQWFKVTPIDAIIRDTIYFPHKTGDTHLQIRKPNVSIEVQTTNPTE